MSISRTAGIALAAGATALMSAGTYSMARSLKESGGGFVFPLRTWDIHTMLLGLGLSIAGAKLGAAAIGGLRSSTPVAGLAVLAAAAVGATVGASYLGGRAADKAEAREKAEWDRPKYTAENWLGSKELGDVLNKYAPAMTTKTSDTVDELLEHFDRNGNNAIDLPSEQSYHFAFPFEGETMWWNWHAGVADEADENGNNDGKASRSELTRQVQQVSGGPMYDNVLWDSWTEASSYDNTADTSITNVVGSDPTLALPRLVRDKNMKVEKIHVEQPNIIGESLSPTEIAQRLINAYNGATALDWDQRDLNFGKVDVTAASYEFPSKVTGFRRSASEFVQAADAAGDQNKRASLDELAALAKTFDADGNGSVNGDELEKLADQYGAMRSSGWFNDTNELIVGSRVVAAERVSNIKHMEFAG